MSVPLHVLIEFLQTHTQIVLLVSKWPWWAYVFVKQKKSRSDQILFRSLNGHRVHLSSEPKNLKPPFYTNLISAASYTHSSGHWICTVAFELSELFFLQRPSVSPWVMPNMVLIELTLFPHFPITLCSNRLVTFYMHSLISLRGYVGRFVRRSVCPWSYTSWNHV